MNPSSRVFGWLLTAALPLLLASRCFFGYSSSGEQPPPNPPPNAFVWIEDADPKVDTASIGLQGQAECPGCFASDWQLGSCPVIECPAAEGDVWWTNHATGDTAAATHAVLPACNCPIFSYGYCYSACRHVWSASVPLTFGDNAIEVFATAPGFATGSDSALVQRAPVPPTWLSADPGAGTVQLSWTPVDGATSYNLYWSTTPYGWAALCTKIENVTSPYLQAGLPSGMTVYYFVTAVAAGVESFDSLRTEAIPQ